MRRSSCFIAVLLIAFLPVRAWAEQIPDGQYTAEVALSGGSGRASVQSPATVTVGGGTVTAEIIWSSPYYENMLIRGVFYYPVNNEGNSAFVIPISFDEEMAVTAQTIAMSQPHQIEYTLRFDSSTLTPPTKGLGSWVLVAIALTAILVILTIVLFWRTAKWRQQRGRQV